MAPRRCSRVLRGGRGGRGGRAWLSGDVPRGPRRKGDPQRQASMRGLRTRRGESGGQARGRTSGAAGHAVVAATRLPPPPPPPRPGGQGRPQLLMPRKSTTEAPPDSRPDPQKPGPTRTLKRFSRRHAPTARRPPAPLLSGLRSAHAQCCRSRRLHAQQACACVPAGSAEVRAQAQTRAARRPSPLPHSEGLQGSPLTVQPASTPRHLHDRKAPSTGLRSQCQRCRDAASQHRPTA